MPNFEPVCCSMSSSNCCFLTCIQVSQKAGKVFWYSHLFKNFPQFFGVIYTAIGVSIVNEAEVDDFLEFSCFFCYPTDVGNMISGSSASSKSSWSIWNFIVHVLLKLGLDNCEPVCCSMSGSNCCFFTSIQISQEEGKVFWYSHLFKNFPEFVVHTVKGLSLVNEEVGVFLKFSCFFYDPTDVGNLISGSSASSKSRLYI